VNATTHCDDPRRVAWCIGLSVPEPSAGAENIGLPLTVSGRHAGNRVKICKKCCLVGLSSRADLRCHQNCRAVNANGPHWPVAVDHVAR